MILVKYMKYLLIGLIKIYQMIPSPIHSLCRHQPTCSNYTMEAIIKYGVLKGSYMGFKRILRCNPLGTSGYDPVPNLDFKKKKEGRK